MPYGAGRGGGYAASRLMAFVDGENLTARFAEMVKEGRTPRPNPNPNNPYMDEAVHSDEAGRFVWSPSTLQPALESGEEYLLRCHYYTTCGQSEDVCDELTRDLSAQVARLYRAGGMPAGGTNLIPRVYRKMKANTRTKSVDINLCVEVMEYVARDALDSLFLVTGDVDYLPLIEATMRSGKRVYVGALSSGISARLRYAADRFIDLNPIYFN